MSRGRWDPRGEVVLYVVAGFTTTTAGAADFALPLNLARIGLPLPAVGTIVALLGLGALASRVPGGAWYRLEHARALIGASLAALGLATLGLATSDEWTLQALFATLHGVTFGLATTFLLALLIEIRAPGGNPAVSMAWYTAAVSAGYAVGAPLAAWTVQAAGHGSAFLAAGGIAFGAAALVAVLRRPVGNYPARRSPSAARGRAGISLAGISAAVWLTALLAFYVNVIGGVFNTFFPIHALAIGVPLATAGVLKSLHAASATGIRFAAALILRYVGVGKANHLSVVAMAVGLYALALFADPLPLAVAFVVMGLARGLVRVTTATTIAHERERPGAHVGLASGVYNAGLDAGTMAGPPIAGVVAGAIGIPATFQVVAVVLPILYYAAWLLARARTPAPAAPTLPCPE